MNHLQTRFAAAWERLIAVKARDEEEARLGRLFNTLIVISTGIVVALSIVFLSMQPLGFLTQRLSWLAAVIPLASIPLSGFCLVQARRGHIRPMIHLYVWVNLIAIGAAAWVFDGIVSPAWGLFFWTVTIAGILLKPATALWMSGGVVSYFLLLLLMTRAGLYAPPISFGVAGREFVHMCFLLIMLVSTVGLLTYLNMNSLRNALGGLKQRTRQLLEAQEELLRKEKLAVLGQVAGSVGHELRNPLGVMSNAVYFLQTVLADEDETTKEYLNIIKSEIADSERIVSDLLDSVRTKPPQPGIVGVQELIDQTLRKCSVPSSVTVKPAIPESLAPLRVDAMQIQQVLRNLISNGVEAMPDGGTLEIRAVENKQDRTITVSVRDSGGGMAPEVLAKLFQPLFTTKARGIGLGLVVVKNLTEANGGSVKVESEVGKGTLFTVTLPAADDRGMPI
jgi:signal transduction histidine kinase